MKERKLMRYIALVIALIVLGYKTASFAEATQIPRQIVNGAYISVDEAGLRVTATDPCNSPSVDISIDTPMIIQSLGERLSLVALDSALGYALRICAFGEGYSQGKFPVSIWYLGKRVSQGTVNWGDTVTIDLEIPPLEYSDNSAIAALQKALDTGWSKSNIEYTAPDSTADPSSIMLLEMRALSEAKMKVARTDCQDSRDGRLEGTLMEKVAMAGSLRASCEVASAIEARLMYRPYAGKLPNLSMSRSSVDLAFSLRKATCFRAYQYAHGYLFSSSTHNYYNAIPEYKEMFSFFEGENNRQTCASYPGLVRENSADNCDAARENREPNTGELLVGLEERAVSTWCKSPGRQSGTSCLLPTGIGEDLKLGMSFTQKSCKVVSAGTALCTMGVKVWFSESIAFSGITGPFANIVNTVPHEGDLLAKYDKASCKWVGISMDDPNGNPVLR